MGLRRRRPGDWRRRAPTSRLGRWQLLGRERLSRPVHQQLLPAFRPVVRGSEPWLQGSASA
eukprot:342527-Pyramimonas_sp.AAC.1